MPGTPKLCVSPLTPSFFAVAHSYYGHFTFLLELATQTMYACVYYMAFSLVLACYDMSLRGLVLGAIPMPAVALPPIVAISCLLGFQILWGLPTGYLSVELNNAANPMSKKAD